MNASYFVESLSDGRLRIADQVDYLFGAGWILPGVILIAFFLYRAVRLKSTGPVVGALLCSSLLFVGARVMSTSSLVLDRGADSAVFHNTAFLGHRNFTVPLSTIHHAEVQSGSHDDHIEVVLKNGDMIPFGDSDQKQGKGRAAHAINTYIGYAEP